VRLAGAVLSAFVLFLAGQHPALAAGDPYNPGDVGYDISWPQCGKPAPSVGSFGVIGVNGGSPFTGNLCMVDQYAAAPRNAPPSLYINTGYQDDYRYLVTSGCRNQSHSIPGEDEERMAWAVGCSEAETSIKYANAFGVQSISMWWLDVEILNKWSLNLALNRFVLQGAVTRLSQTGLPVGIYSSLPMWLLITGSMMAPGYLSAEWNAAGACGVPFTPMTQLPVWLGQHVYDDLDHDTAC
jgi:hypothetical protein